jgi:hypothetical protein
MSRCIKTTDRHQVDRRGGVKIFGTLASGGCGGECDYPGNDPVTLAHWENL